MHRREFSDHFRHGPLVHAVLFRKRQHFRKTFDGRGDQKIPHSLTSIAVPLLAEVKIPWLIAARTGCARFLAAAKPAAKLAAPSGVEPKNSEPRYSMLRLW